MLSVSPKSFVANCYVALFFLFMVVSIQSCTKTDFADKSPVQELRERFFTAQKPVGQQTLVLIKRLKQQNEQHNFTDALPGHIGLPHWEKMLLVPMSRHLSRGDSSLGYMIIPFTVTGTYLEGLLLAIPQTDSGYHISFYSKEFLKEVCTKTNKNVTEAENLLGMFMVMENYFFNRENFYHIPLDLFPTNVTARLTDSTKVASLIADTENGDGGNGKHSSCKYVPSGVHHPHEEGACDWRDFCEYCTAIYCINETPQLPEPPIPGGGGSGGGSPGGGTPPGGGGGSCTTCPPPGDCRMPFYIEDPCEPTPPASCNSTVAYLNSVLGMTSAESEWLCSHYQEASVIKQAILDDILAQEPVDGEVIIAPTIEAKAASRMTLNALMHNCISGPYNTEHLNRIKIYIPNYQNYGNIDPMFWVFFRMKCIILRIEHPEWSSIRIYWEATNDIIHGSLDLLGMVPFIGEVADLANGIIYSIEGDGVNATLSYASMIPFAGWASTGVKWAKKTITLANGSKRTLQWIKQTNNIISFGDRGLLRKVLGLASGDPRKAHHLIPWEHFDDPLVQKAASGGGNPFNLNEIMNGIPLTEVQHSGSHALYNQRVKNKLQQIYNTYGGDAISPELARSKIDELVNQIRTAILNNPNVSVNNIVF